jgi:hypothetical protein
MTARKMGRKPPAPLHAALFEFWDRNNILDGIGATDALIALAERGGFEPPRPFRVYTLSRRAP